MLHNSWMASSSCRASLSCADLPGTSLQTYTRTTETCRHSIWIALSCRERTTRLRIFNPVSLNLMSVCKKKEKSDDLLDRELCHHRWQIVEAVRIQSPHRLLRLLRKLVLQSSGALLSIWELVLIVGVAGDRRRRLEQLLVVFFAVHRETCSAAEPAHACNSEEISGGIVCVWCVDGYILPQLLLLSFPFFHDLCQGRGRGKGYIYTRL